MIPMVIEALLARFQNSTLIFDSLKYLKTFIIFGCLFGEIECLASSGIVRFIFDLVQKYEASKRICGYFTAISRNGGKQTALTANNHPFHCCLHVSFNVSLHVSLHVIFM
jgi:hypothetical protein